MCAYVFPEKRDKGSNTPDFSIQINSQKDHDKEKEVREYVSEFLEYLKEKQKNDLYIALKDADFALNPYKSAYTNRGNQSDSCFFNHKKTEIFRSKNTNSVAVILTLPGEDSRKKLVDFVMRISSEAEVDIENLMKELNLFEKEKPARTKLLKGMEVDASVEQYALTQVAQVAEIVTNPKPVLPEVVIPSEPTPMLVEPQKKDIGEVSVLPEALDMTITDELLHNLLYLFLEDQKTELVDEKEKLYFVPESSIDAILKDGAVYNLNTKFITEKVIKMNLPLALSRKKGYAKLVIRVDNTLFKQKEENLPVSIKDQLELLMAGISQRQTHDGVEVVFVPHNLDDIKVAIQTTIDDNFDENLRLFYTSVNQGLPIKRPLVRKGFLLKLPNDFDKSSYNHPRLQAMSGAEIKENIAKLSDQVTAGEGMIQSGTQKIQQLESQILTLRNQIIQLESENKQRSLQLHQDLQQVISQVNLQLTSIAPTETLNTVVQSIENKIDFLLTAKAQLESRKQEFDDAGNILNQVEKMQQEIQNLETQKADIEQEIEQTDEQISVYKIELQSYEREKQRRLDLLKKQMEELA